MIKNKTGERVEKKSMVCVECITLMSPTDHREHDGKCQLCRGETSGARLYLFDYCYANQREYDWRIYPTDSCHEAEQLFAEERADDYGECIEDFEFEYIDVTKVETYGNYRVHIVRA
jgi:hypothetical protein